MTQGRSPLQLAFGFVRRHKIAFSIAVFWRALWELVPMQIPIFAGAIVDGLTGKASSVYGWQLSINHPLDVIQFGAMGLLLIALLYGICSFLYTVAGAALSRRFVWELRTRVCDKVTTLSVGTHQRHGPGDLLDRTLRDTDRLREFPDQVFIRTCTNVLRAGYPIAMLFLMSPPLAVLALSVIPPQWLITWYLQRKLYVATQDGLNRQSDLTGSLKETLDGIETVQTLQAEKATVRRLEEQISDVEHQEARCNRITGFIRATIWLFTTLGIALVWWQGSLLVISNALTVGTLIAFIGFSELAYRPFRYFTNTVKAYQQGLASLERICELLNQPPTIVVQPNSPALQVTEGKIELEHVSFSYSDEPILRDVQLTIEPGQMTAIVGRSGSGKSSLLRLLPRLYDPESGDILIEGQNVCDVNLESLRAAIGVVPQTPVILSGTIADNLRMGNPDATELEMTSACQSAGAWEFIRLCPDGLQTQIGRHGIRLSGGQSQRIALARTLLKKPKILLLDEPTSALDAESQAIIVHTLSQLRGSVTMVIVGHRLSTIQQADKIVVMEAGKVHDEGTHPELIARCNLYNDLFPTARVTYGATHKPIAA